MSPTSGFLVVKRFDALYRAFASDPKFDKDIYALPLFGTEPDRVAVKYRGVAREAVAPFDKGSLYIDPNTKKPIVGTPDLGHKPGNEFWREKEAAEKAGMTQKEFNDHMNNPAFYQWEDPSSNRSHKNEKP